MFSNELLLAVNTAIKAGKLIMEVYRSDNKEVANKDDDSPVTRADMLSHRLIHDALQKTQYQVLSEEGNPNNWSDIKKQTRYWLIDPLDGTKDFIRGNDEFTVNIALIENNRPILGVIYVPCKDELYVGIIGVGAWHMKNVTPEAVLTPDDLASGAARLPLSKKNDTYTIVGSKSHFTPQTETFIAKISQYISPVQFVRAGSALKFCLVATGQADLYPRMDSIMEWDTAAGQAIVEAAGGHVRRWPDGQPLSCSNADMRNPEFIAVAPGRDLHIFFENLD